jgi:FkbM family methyltransferase
MDTVTIKTDFGTFHTPTTGAEIEALKEGRILQDKAAEEVLRHVPPETTLIHVGAYVGILDVYWAKRLPENYIYSFEPQTALYRMHKANLRANQVRNVTVENGAVYEHSGIVPMVYPQLTKRMNSYGMFGIDPFNVPDSLTPLVDCVTLDECNFKDVSFIKISARGADLGVIGGAEKTIARDKPMIMLEFDTGPTAVNEEGKPYCVFDNIWDDYQAVIDGIGYKVVWNRGHDYLIKPA